MSRLYGMDVTISGHVPERIDAIKRAATEEWGFEDWFDRDGGEVESYAESRGDSTAAFRASLDRLLLDPKSVGPRLP